MPKRSIAGPRIPPLPALRRRFRGLAPLLALAWLAPLFVAAVVVLVSALRHGATPKRVAMLRELTGASRRTIERWREWWQDGFVRSPFWKAVRGRLKKPVDRNALPLSLLNAFSGEGEKTGLISLLRLLLPLSTPMQPF